MAEMMTTCCRYCGCEKWTQSGQCVKCGRQNKRRARAYQDKKLRERFANRPFSERPTPKQVRVAQRQRDRRGEERLTEIRAWHRVHGTNRNVISPTGSHYVGWLLEEVGRLTARIQELEKP